MERRAKVELFEQIRRVRNSGLEPSDPIRRRPCCSTRSGSGCPSVSDRH
jgi:hypothetical protein